MTKVNNFNTTVVAKSNDLNSGKEWLKCKRCGIKVNIEKDNYFKLTDRHILCEYCNDKRLEYVNARNM